MKTFCTEGPIDKEKNYYVPRADLLQEGIDKADNWKYFTIFAPRQSGKTTYFQMLVEELNEKRPQTLPIWVSFEDYQKNTVEELLVELCKDINRFLESNRINYKMERPERIEDLKASLLKLSRETKKDIILIIDEIEGLTNSETLNTLMHAIRKLYHLKKAYRLKSVILTGVSNITGIIQDNASPFNISDELIMPYFTKDETTDLLEQHEEESGQLFQAEVKEQLWQNTAGQPGLINAMARDLVEKKARDKRKISMKDFEKTLNDFMKNYIDKNISNIINKARQHEELVKKIVFEPNTIEFNIYDERIKFLHVNGVVDNCEGTCCVKVPLYYKALYEYLKPRVNGERKFMIQRMENLSRYIADNGEIRIERLIDKYITYVEKRGGIQFKGRKQYEGVYHYNLDAFLSSYVEELGGKLFPEARIGGGSVDLMLIFKEKEYLIEIKSDPSPQEYKKGKKQLTEYVLRNAQKEGYYIIFDSLTKENQKTSYSFNEVKIHEWTVKTHYEYPSIG